MSRTKIITISIIVILFIIILIQNTDVITFNLLFWEVNTSMFYIPLIIVCSIGAGYLLAKYTGRTRKKKDADVYK